MLKEYIRLALRTLRTYRLRSVLTVLAITIGVSSVILLVSLAQSGLATLSKGIEDLGGTRFIMLWEDSPKKAVKKLSNYTGGLRYSDAIAIKERIPGIASMTAIFNGWNEVPARSPGMPEHKTDLIGTDDQFAKCYAMTLAAGRFLEPRDLEGQSRVCVLGFELAKALFPDEEAVGKEVMVDGRRYSVIGRMAFGKKGGMNFGFSWNDLAMVPISTVRPDGRIAMLSMTTDDPKRNLAIIDRANALLLKRHNDVDDFQFLDFGGMLKGFYMVFYAMIFIVGLIAGMSLLIGGVGIMNIMLVAVVERRREIGLRKSVGAPESAIMGQFLTESVMLSLLGAVVGTVVGLTLAWAGAEIGPLINKTWVGIISYPAVGLAVLAAAATGLFFGWYPALQAARLDPIVCLRSD